MAVRIKKGDALSTINMTPVIDMVFLLLIFFLVASRFAEEERHLAVVLPSASEAKPLVAAPTELFVNIDAAGDFFVDGRRVNEQELESLLRQSVVNNPSTQSVIIRADKKVALERVVVVMNLCNRTGVHGYSVATADESP
ncbi:MAG: biopolymer transporter ExbD [Planctomycetes bacterium]|nr:biopolymer transporter ExbD [Planctomycetota bacterium]